MISREDARARASKLIRQGIARLDTPEELMKLGHGPTPMLKVIRLACLDCCYGSPKEVDLCQALACFNYPYRHGIDPFKKQKQPSEAQLLSLDAGRKKRMEKFPAAFEAEDGIAKEDGGGGRKVA